MERLSLAFTKKLERVLSGEERNVRPVAVGLRDGGKAEVVIKVLQPVTFDRLVVLAVARHKESGWTVGEQHVHMDAVFDGRRWHTHIPAYCRGFKHQGGKFTHVEFGAAEGASTQPTDVSEEPLLGPTDEEERAARLGIRIVRSLLHSGLVYDALAPDDTSEAFRLARTLMRGEGDPRSEEGSNRLLVDPILQLALNQRIAEPSGH